MNGIDTRRCDNDPHVIAAVAKLFWADRKLEKVRRC
jgi:pre-mRNA-processing factor 6